jgi:tetratricopeptide (TPR) repeat protein
MRSCVFGVVLAVALFSPMMHSQDDNGLAAYKAGNFEAAIPLLQAAAARSPSDASIQAALLSALLYENRVDGASDLSQRDESAFPNSPAVIAARGEFAFYMGDMPQAERLFKAAIKLQEATPRAVYGMSRLYRAASFRRSARLTCMRAHEIDPDDALIMQGFLQYAPLAKRKEWLPPFAAAHPWLYQHYRENGENSAAVETSLGDKKPRCISIC